MKCNYNTCIYSSPQVVVSCTGDIIRMLISKINLDDCTDIAVRRSHLLQDALKEARKLKFDAKKLLKVNNNT